MMLMSQQLDGERNPKRLKGMRAYLCGPMEFAEDNGIGWRDDMSDFIIIELGGIPINPANKPTDLVPEDPTSIANRKRLKQTDLNAYAKECRLMRCVDLRLTDIADYMIVHLDQKVPSCGTWEELFIANRSKKPIIVHYAQGKLSAPDWLFGTLPHEMIFSTWVDVKDYLLHIHKDHDIKTQKRWLFFEQARL